MTCHEIVDNDGKTTGFICSTPSYYTFVGKKRVNFLYGPYYGVDVLNEKGRTRQGTHRELDAIIDWLHRNTYKRPRDRELIGYVKPRWKP